MNAATTAAPAVQALTRIDSHLSLGHQRSLAEDVREGLTQPVKELPSKHLYDARGSDLFDRICSLPEYYPARTEHAILERSATSIAALTKLVELGSGTATKTRVLLDALHATGTLRRYVPIDVAATMVRESVEALVEEYPGLQAHGVIGDFERHLDRLPRPLGTRLLALLGGTLGNLKPNARHRLLRQIATLLDPADQLLLGVDLIKDCAVLEAAYNDQQGVTAEFNRNVLLVVNRELQANFDPDDFAHIAPFDPQQGWIEMRLRAQRHHTVNIQALDMQVRFQRGEDIRTEISAKFTRARLEQELSGAGLKLVNWFTDTDALFALALSRPAAAT
jgi:L-histidine Nalpha-methyltransferase